MSEEEKRKLHVGHSTGLLHAYYLLRDAHPAEAQVVADHYAGYCRTLRIFNHLTGEPNDKPAPTAGR